MPESLLIILRRGYTICDDVSGAGEEEDVRSSPSVSAEVSRISAAQPSADTESVCTGPGEEV